MRLRQPLTLAECQKVRGWRNDPKVLPGLRTGYKTAQQQGAFYRHIICNPEAPHWYYAICDGTLFLGMGGLTYLLKTPGEAEISLILGPEFRGCGYGADAVDALLAEAWNRGLATITGECKGAGNVGFWKAMLYRYPPSMERPLPDGGFRWWWTRAHMTDQERAWGV